MNSLLRRGFRLFFQYAIHPFADRQVALPRALREFARELAGHGNEFLVADFDVEMHLCSRTLRTLVGV